MNPFDFRLTEMKNQFYVLTLLFISCITACSPSRKEELLALQTDIQGIQAFTNIEDAQAYSKETDKPIFLIFDAWNTSMRKSSMILTSYLKKEVNPSYTVAYLFVDDKTKLSDPYEYILPSGKSKKITTIGDQNMILEIDLLNRVAAPYHVIVDHELTLIKEPLGFISNEQMIKDYLSIH